MPANAPTTSPAVAPVGQPISRVDGRLKVTGHAVYSGDALQPDMAHAVLVGSPIARGTLKTADTTAADRAPGVLKVITPFNMPDLRKPKPGNPMTGGSLLEEQRMPLEDKDVGYAGQYVAVVVADTLDQARHAADLISFTYDAQSPMLKLSDADKSTKPSESNGEPLQIKKGSFDGAIKTAKADGSSLVLEATYDTPVETHNPMEMHATTAAWTGTDKLTVWDATQYVSGVQATLASVFDLQKDSVRVLTPFVGGAFGCKGVQWPHTIIAAFAAQLVGRPVRLMLTRNQMFTNVGHRPATRQAMTLAASADGRLQGVGHDTQVQGSVAGDFIETCGMGTSRVLYGTESMAISHTLQKLNVGAPTFMRAPGEAPGMFALESAMDELAIALKVDPVALRLTNYAATHPQTGLPWSGKHLNAAYKLGADQFGWAKYTPQVGSMKTDDGRLVGWGFASATYPANRFPGTVRIRLMKAEDGGLRAVAATSAHDIGTGLYTVGTQMAAAQLGLPPERVKMELGDTALPYGPVAGGSTSTATVGQALVDAGRSLRGMLLKLAGDLGEAAMYGLGSNDVVIEDGRLVCVADASRSVGVAKLIDASGRAYVEGHAGPPMKVGREDQVTGLDYGKTQEKFAPQSFGCHFVEVVIDRPCPRVIVKRVVSVMDVGTIINPKTARSQVLGGVVMGLGMALTEQTEYDATTGKPINDNLADYNVCVNADVPPIEVHFVGAPDYNFNAMGCRGVGEIGITGITAAVANAVYHATGRRVRDLPITPDKLM